RWNRLRAERLQPARPLSRGDARTLLGRGHRVGAVLPAGVGVPWLPQCRRRFGGVRCRRRDRRDTRAGGAGVVVGPLAEHPADPRDPLVRPPGTERRRGRYHAAGGCGRTPRRRGQPGAVAARSGSVRQRLTRPRASEAIAANTASAIDAPNTTASPSWNG